MGTPLVTDCRSLSALPTQEGRSAPPTYKVPAGCQRTRQGHKALRGCLPVVRRQRGLGPRVNRGAGVGRAAVSHAHDRHRAAGQRPGYRELHSTHHSDGTHGIGKGNPCYLGLAMFSLLHARQAHSSLNRSCSASSGCTTGRRPTAGPGWMGTSSTRPATRWNAAPSSSSWSDCGRPACPAHPRLLLGLPVEPDRPGPPATASNAVHARRAVVDGGLCSA